MVVCFMGSLGVWYFYWGDVGLLNRYVFVLLFRNVFRFDSLIGNKRYMSLGIFLVFFKLCFVF